MRGHRRRELDSPFKNSEDASDNKSREASVGYRNFTKCRQIENDSPDSGVVCMESVASLTLVSLLILSFQLCLVRAFSDAD